jgi:hypothetical protein
MLRRKDQCEVLCRNALRSYCVIPKEVNIDPFDGAKSVYSARRGAPFDAVHRASAATMPLGGSACAGQIGDCRTGPGGGAAGRPPGRLIAAIAGFPPCRFGPEPFH